MKFCHPSRPLLHLQLLWMEMFCLVMKILLMGSMIISASVADVLIKDNFVACSTSNVNRDDCSNVTNPKLNLPCISHEFVNNEILGMSTKKATGLDDISCKILKLARPVIVDSLTFHYEFVFIYWCFSKRMEDCKGCAPS